MSGRELALDWRWLICATLSAWGPPPQFRQPDKSLPPVFAECLLSSGDVEEAGEPAMSEEGSCTQETHLPPGQRSRSREGPPCPEVMSQTASQSLVT